MSRIFWIDKPIEFKIRNYSTLDKPYINCQSKPGWFYDSEDDGIYDGFKKEFPHFEISMGNILLTRNGSLIKMSKPSFTTSEKRPTEVKFSFFKDTITDRDGPLHEGSMTYYDKYLNHRSGNHIEKFSGYDIVGLYDDSKDKCPCCKRRYDGLGE